MVIDDWTHQSLKRRCKPSIAETMWLFTGSVEFARSWPSERLRGFLRAKESRVMQAGLARLPPGPLFFICFEAASQPGMTMPGRCQP